MAPISIIKDRNFDESANWALTNSEAFTIYSGFQLTINSDNAWSQNYAVIGSGTIDASTGGKLFVDGTTVRWLSYSNGVGTVPTILSGLAYPYPSGVVGLSSNASGEYLGIWSSLASNPLSTGGVLPTSGFIKLRTVSGTFQNSEWVALPGGASGVAVGADVPGWLNIRGSNAGTLNIPRLGTFVVSGSWFTLGTSNGSAGQTFLFYVADHCPAIWIETGMGSNIFSPWVNIHARLRNTNVSGIGPFSQVFSGNANGLCTFGNDIIGQIPRNGARLIVPNIHFSSSAVPYTSNDLNTTLGNRYDLTTTSAGNVNIQNASLNWFLGATSTFNQPYSVTLQNVSTSTAIDFSECATRFLLSGVVVAPSNSIDGIPLTLTNNSFGGDIKNCYFYRSAAGASSYGISATQCFDINVTGCYLWHCDGTSTQATRTPIFLTQCQNWQFDDCEQANGKVLNTTCDSIVYNNHKIGDAPINNTGRTTTGATMMDFTTFCSNITVNGFGTPSGCLPMYNVAAINITNTINAEIKNIGTLEIPFNGRAMTSVFLTLATGNNKNIKVKRVYANNLRTSTTALYTDLNSNNQVLFQNFGSTTEGLTTPTSLNMIWKGCRFQANAALGTTFTSVYGTHFYDYFVASNSGLIGLIFTEKTNDTISSNAYAVSGTAAFSSTGRMALTTSGHEVVYTWPYYILGYSGFDASFTPARAGTNTGNFTVNYDMDYNTGSGFTGTYKLLSAANLGAEAISPTNGFKPKIQIICNTTNGANALTGLYFRGVTNLSIQASGLYPLDSVAATLTLTDLVENSEVRVYAAGTTTELAGIENSTTSFTYDYTWEGTDTLVDIVIHHQDYEYIRYTNLTLNEDGLTLPIQQVFDRNYSNP